MTYKLATYEVEGRARAGIVVGDLVHDAAALTGRAAYESVQGILDDWDAADAALEKASQTRERGRKLAEIQLRAPVPTPGDIYCAGANYTDHIAEMVAALRVPALDRNQLGKPWHFIKSSRSVSDPDGLVQVPPDCQKLDWEIELVAVIGRPARNLRIDNALSCVAGYTVGNDLSARDLHVRRGMPEASPFRSDWIAQKSFVGACPLGPWITPARDVRDPQDLGLKLWVNDVLKQNSNTSFMIYSLAEQIAQLTHRAQLCPGDIIMTGTPAGVGTARGEFLKPGDAVKAWIESLGTLITRIG